MGAGSGNLMPRVICILQHNGHNKVVDLAFKSFVTTSTTLVRPYLVVQSLIEVIAAGEACFISVISWNLMLLGREYKTL